MSKKLTLINLILKEMQILEPGEKIKKMDIKNRHFVWANKNEIKAIWTYKDKKYSAINLGLFNQSIWTKTLFNNKQEEKRTMEIKKCNKDCDCSNGKKTLKKVMRNRGYALPSDLPSLANHNDTRLIPLLIRTHCGRLIVCAQNAESLVKDLDKDWWIRDVSIAGEMINGMTYIGNINMTAP